MPDIPYLSEAVRHIVNHPSEWDQEVWVCGTTACLAGRICLLAGATFKKSGPGMTDPDMAVLGDRGTTISDMAARLAHLYPWEARWLFDAGRTMPELVTEVGRLERGLALSSWSPDRTPSNGGVYCDDAGIIQVARHRATTYYRNSHMTPFRDHPTPEYARQYVSHVLSRLEPLIYRNISIAEDRL